MGTKQVYRGRGSCREPGTDAFDFVSVNLCPVTVLYSLIRHENATCIRPRVLADYRKRPLNAGSALDIIPYMREETFFNTPMDSGILRRHISPATRIRGSGNFILGIARRDNGYNS
jgi:hypothetical protein